MACFVPEEELLSPEELALLQRRKLTDLLREVLATNRFYRRKLSGVRFDGAKNPLGRLPFTTRGELQEDQATEKPYGCNLTYPRNCYTRLHQTSGSMGVPLRWLDTPESWAWWKKCWGIIYRAAEVSDSDRLLFPFSFGPFIGFWGAFEAASSLGNFCLPCGGMTTTARLRHLIDHEATVVCCTPTYALRLAEVATEQGIDLPRSAVRALIVAGEPGGHIAEIRARLESSWGARVFDHVGMTEVGPWGVECGPAPQDVHVMESEFIAEVVDPATGSPVANGEAGELVLTNLGRTGSPVIRYRTGDQVTLVRERCPCGRWFARAIGGVRGRLDDMLLIRGNNVFPSAIEGLVRGFDEVREFRIKVESAGAMAELVLEVEVGEKADAAGLCGRIETAIRDRLHFKPKVSVVEPGSLPRFEMKANRLVRP